MSNEILNNTDMKQQEKPIVAMIYDFDGTLAPGNMQEYDFLKEIGIEDKDDFWREVRITLRTRAPSRRMRLKSMVPPFLCSRVYANGLR